MNSEKFAEAVKFYLELIATGDAEAKDDLIATIDNGAGTMGVGWPGWYLPTEASNADYTAITGRTDNDSPARNANVYGVWTIGVPSCSREPELSAKLVSFLMDAQVQKKTVAFGGVPCRYSCLRNQEVLQKFPQYLAVCSALEGGIYRPIMENWSDFYTILGQEMKKIIEGKLSVEEGLAIAQARLEEEL